MRLPVSFAQSELGTSKETLSKDETNLQFQSCERGPQVLTYGQAEDRGSLSAPASFWNQPRLASIRLHRSPFRQVSTEFLQAHTYSCVLLQSERRE